MYLESFSPKLYLALVITCASKPPNVMNGKPHVSVFVDKANESLGMAETLLENGRSEDAVLSCYHATFFMIRALLVKSRIDVQKTSDSLLAFHDTFVQTGLVPGNCWTDIQEIISVNGFSATNPSLVVTPAASKDIYVRANGVCDTLANLMS